MIWISELAGISKDVGNSPSAIVGKSSRGNVASEKRARPAFTAIRPSAACSCTCDPSGNFRAISNRVCAETVVAPGVSTSAANVSTTCKSRSVAVSLILPPSLASMRTLDKIGMVLRRSTTDWTWLRLFSRVARSIVALIQNPLVGPGGQQTSRKPYFYAESS